MKFQLHVSGLLTMSKCGIQFEKRYIQGLRVPSSVAAAVGTAVDRSVRADLRSKIDMDALLSEEQVADVARDALVEEWSNGVEANEEDADEGLTASRDEAIDKSVDLAVFHRAIVAPGLRPTHVARGWTLDVDGLDIQLAGEIDIQEGHHSIRDTKTTAKSPTKTLADTSLQLTTYALAVRQHDKVIPETVALDYLVRTPKRHDLKLVQLESTRTDASFGPLLERVHQAQLQIESGIFTPAPPDSWQCSRKYCPFFEKCKFAVKPVSASVAA